jgi:hypothetical protein
MVSDRQVRRVMELMQTEKTKALAADKAGMDAKTARRYVRLGKVPSELRVGHTWRTRDDPFKAVWEKMREMLASHPGLEAKTLFEDLQRKRPGEFSDGQLRTLQRRIKRWRALEGPGQEVYFAQEHRPGELCQSDFTDMGPLAITIGGMRFDHLIYHLVLTYSNWETGTICFSESFESLSEGLQNALWELGGVPVRHQTDRLTAAVQKTTHPDEFTARYSALLRHYGLEGKKTNAREAHENGDVEQRHHRLKRTVDQALMLRGSRNFSSRDEYSAFLRMLFTRMNSGRRKHLEEELELLHMLPAKRLEACKRIAVRVGPSSTIRVNHNTYSVESRMIGEMVDVRLYAEHLDVCYAGQCVETIPRLRGEGGHYIQYRHIIEWLVRKPGAFENFRFREDLFPTHRFRVAYDQMRREHSWGIDATKSYLAVLHLAAKEGEQSVDRSLERLLGAGRAITHEAVQEELTQGVDTHTTTREVNVAPVDLSIYDMLLENVEVAA